jgi:hypothetical protein
MRLREPLTYADPTGQMAVPLLPGLYSECGRGRLNARPTLPGSGRNRHQPRPQRLTVKSG